MLVEMNAFDSIELGEHNHEMLLTNLMVDENTITTKHGIKTPYNNKTRIQPRNQQNIFV